MWDIFGIKKRKKKKAENLKAFKKAYRSMSPAKKREHQRYLTERILHSGFFRDELLIMELRSVVEVLEEDYNEDIIMGRI